MKRGGGGKEGRERLYPTIVNLKYSVRQLTEPLIGSKLDRWLKPDSCLLLHFTMASDEEDSQRALDFLAQKGFDRELIRKNRNVQYYS